MVDIVEILGSSSSLFSDLGVDALREIAPLFRRTRFQTGETLFREGEVGDDMLVVASGELSVLKDLGWGRRELGRVGPFEMLGEMAVITGEKRSATIRAACETECLWLGRADFSQLLDNSPKFAQRVLKLVIARQRTSTETASHDLVAAQQALIFSLAALADSRDPQTGQHLQRVRSYCALLSERLARLPEYADTISARYIERVYFVSPLHDIGKVAIPDGILLKKGPLSPEEYGIMKGHAAIGANTLQSVLDRCDDEVFRMAYRLVRNHHERFDGDGYPDGLAGEDIPLEARIMAVADVYDALVSERVYKQAYTYEQTVEEMKQMAGPHLDPVIVEEMLAIVGEFEDIRKQIDEGAER
jgi:HD-GYP domain-containing protein (c-di-GMP phosphodiesterase class II)